MKKNWLEAIAKIAASVAVPFENHACESLMIAKTVAIEIKIAGNFMLKFESPKIEMLKFWRIRKGKFRISLEKIFEKLKFAESVALSISLLVKAFGETKIV